jgi:hypothetical protein
VLDALARALRLDIKATEHLYRLAGLRTAHSPRPVAETAADGLDQLIDQISLSAIVTNRYQDALAANAIARASSPGFARAKTYRGGGCSRFLRRLGRGDRGRGERLNPSVPTLYQTARSARSALADRSERLGGARVRWAESPTSYRVHRNSCPVWPGVDV